MKRVLALVLLAGGCYHYTFEQRPDERASGRPMETVTYVSHPHTWLNGFVGNGRMDARRFCEHPVRTELRVTARDVAIGVGTLLIYTPHTLYVTCEAPPRL